MKTLDIYRKLNVHGSGTITIKDTRKKLYNYYKTDCKKEDIKNFLLENKGSTVFYHAPQYAPEQIKAVIYIKATNFEKHATVEQKKLFTEQRNKFLKF